MRSIQTILEVSNHRLEKTKREHQIMTVGVSTVLKIEANIVRQWKKCEHGGSLFWRYKVDEGKMKLMEIMFVIIICIIESII